MVQVHAEDDTEEEKEEEERERRREALFGMGGDVLGVDTDAQNHYGLEAPKPVMKEPTEHTAVAASFIFEGLGYYEGLKGFVLYGCFFLLFIDV
jgi:hypothetical protein